MVDNKSVDHLDGVENGRINGTDDVSNDRNDYDSCDGGESVGDKNADYPNDTVAKKIATRETRFVTYLRLGLLVILLLAAATVITTVYNLLVAQEANEFERAYVDYSSKLAEAFQSIAVRRLGAIATLSTSITSFALGTNATWPFVTFPKFEAQVRHINELAGVDTTAFAVVVEAKDRAEWEQKYVKENFFQWVEESMTINDLFNPTTNTTVPEESNSVGQILPEYEGRPDLSNGYASQIFDYIFNSEGELRPVISKGEGPFLPWWQNAPVPRSTGGESGNMNVDMNTDPTFDRDLLGILSRNKAAVGGITFTKLGGTNNPASSFYYPVLKDLPEDSPLGGSLGTFIFWLDFFSDILPQGAVGLIGVIENTREDIFSIQIDGASVTFLGEGDLHDPKYDYLRQEISFTQAIQESIEKKKYLGLPLDEMGCQYTLHIYASSNMEDAYTTNRPVTFTVVAFLIFLVTSLLFLSYDRIMERRQRLVQREAEKSGAIVSSLFPAAYHERLMADQATRQHTNTLSPDKGSRNSLLKSFLNGDLGANTTGNDQPIADLFPDCTVMFADMAGFTHWSSKRDPAQVFCLLQEVYGAFDALAKRFRIFKVETIGDCYMAVTGLPEPQPDHARLMARFANECLLQMQEVTTRLSDRLGDGTVELALRVGLHSGPVTAGILRGEKSRFQLFGDSVNTASRMESTGEKNRIQISSTTAELLREAGKGHWLLPREDLVEAKGKGQMQTFWLECDRGRSTVSSTTPANIPATTSFETAASMDADLQHGDDLKKKGTATKRRTSVGDLFDI
jgi:class 3 adenylate cyclase